MNNLAEKKPIKGEKSKSRSGWAVVHKNRQWDPQFTLPQPLDAWKAIELIRAHFATIEYKQALHKMPSNSDNQRQRRLNGDRNNGCRDDGSRSAWERSSLVWKSRNNSHGYLKSSEKCPNTPTRAEKQSVQRIAKPAVCIKRNHFQTVCTSKDKVQSRNTSCLDENALYDDKASDEDEKHTFSSGHNHKV